MRVRYLSWITVAVAAAFSVVASTSLPAGAVSPITLGISIGTAVIGGALAVAYRRHRPSRIAGLATAALSAWTIVASQVFSQATVISLALASGLGLVALALAGLTAHELDGERVVHSLQVNAEDREPAHA